jgi:hypothetical protein
LAQLPLQLAPQPSPQVTCSPQLQPPEPQLEQLEQNPPPQVSQQVSYFMPA